MTLFGLADRVQETSTSTGSGTISLAGAVTGYQSFISAIGAESPCCYVIAIGSDWETGVGIIHSGGFLSRESVLASSNSNAVVTLPAGTKNVFISRLSGMQDAVLVTTMETVSALDAVIFRCQSLTVDTEETPPGAIKADARVASKSTHADVLGFCVHGAKPGKPVLVRNSGIAPFNSLTPGAEYFLSNTPGGITSTMPANARSVGAATAERALLIRISGVNGPILQTADYFDTLGFFGPGFNSGNRTAATDYIDITSDSTGAAARGTTAFAVASYCLNKSSANVFLSGGSVGSGSPSYESSIQVGAVAVATGNLVDTGDLTVARAGLAAISGSVRGYMGGGTGGSGQSNVIDYITYSTFTTASADCGDLLLARSYLAGVGAGTTGFFAGGFNTVFQSEIDKIDTLTSTQNATSRGDLLERKRSLTGAMSEIARGLTPAHFAGGYNGDYLATIEALDANTYSTIAIDRGELLIARASAGAVRLSGTTAFGGGSNGSELLSIEYLAEINNAINVSDRGDLAYARHSLAGI